MFIRRFLEREFKDHHHRDYFDFANTAQVFILESPAGVGQRLVVPKDAFDCFHFYRLCNQQLVNALTLAAANGAERVTLMPVGGIAGR